MSLKKILFNIYKVLNLLLCILLLLLGYNYYTGIFLTFLLITLVCVLIIRSYLQKNNICLIIFIYIFIYTYVFIYPFILDYKIAVYTDFMDNKYLYKSGCLFFIFLSTLNFFIKIPKQNDIKIIQSHNNTLIFIINFIIAIFCMIRGKTGEMILVDGYGNTINEKNSLTEYFLIFFVVCLIFSKGARYKKIALYVLAMVFCMRNILYGGRIEIVMLGICLFLWYFQFKIKNKSIILYSIFAFYCFSVFGSIRKNPLIWLSDEWYRMLIPQFVNTSHIIVNQEGDINYAASRMIGMVDDGVINFSDRCTSLFYFIVSIITPRSNLPPIAILASYNNHIFPTGGGGLITGYFYIYFSYIGVFFIAFFLSKVLSDYRKFNTSSFYCIYTYMIVCTIPRWFAYDPITMFKLSLYGAIISYFFICIDYTVKKCH
ncbi:hypothetical protein EZS27_011954 [termite gut metagenome]|uniref:Oligosaccharide repeat unit polymerase n=1 Tax=termite gut metagenome TaxID=433724 RepID=A0A5J4S1U4_9ZZZZ